MCGFTEPEVPITKGGGMSFLCCSIAL